jgi:hypothetical protein
MLETTPSKIALTWSTKCFTLRSDYSYLVEKGKDVRFLRERRRGADKFHEEKQGVISKETEGQKTLSARDAVAAPPHLAISSKDPALYNEDSHYDVPVLVI